MEIENPEFLPSPDLSREEMESLQGGIAEKAVFEDRLDFPRSLEDLTVAGIDQAFLDEKAVSAIVVMENGEVVERVHGVADLELPYIPGLLAFREVPAIVKALEKLEEEPDILLLDGSGRIHFREAGIATHVGVLFDVPSVGVAKNLLCGRPEEDFDRLETGKRIPVKADESVEKVDSGTIGYVYQSKQYENSGINSLYISPGHRISNETAVEIVGNWIEGYKLPEPVRLADKYVDQVKQELG